MIAIFANMTQASAVLATRTKHDPRIELMKECHRPGALHRVIDQQTAIPFFK